LSWQVWEDPRAVLKRYGLRPKRGFSQNFLVSRGAVENIAAAVRAESGEVVVELGPGVGTLTAALLRRGLRVVAVEKDPAMRDVLEREFGSDAPLEVVDGDAAEVDLLGLTPVPPRAVVGNLPYSITGGIFRNLIAQQAGVNQAVLMVQREVRDRLLAKPSGGDYGALTVFVQAAFEVEPVCLVKAGAFFPAPKVDSAVVRLVGRGDAATEETEEFRGVVRASFQQRRKTLRNALSALTGDRDLAQEMCGRANIDPSLRGETLSVAEFKELSRAWRALQSVDSPDGPAKSA
jgi:16S rRNA (adenine1518-N6/adenine1519-N6)-dimethyltransferase